MKVSFVIPFFDNFHLTSQLLLDIQTYSPSVDEVLLLDNGSVEQETRDRLKHWLETTFLSIHVERVKDNVGFLKICNWGIPKSETEAIVLISNDVRISSDLANEVRKKLQPNTILGGVLYRGSTGWNEFDGVIYPYLEGWLLGFRKFTWEEVGGFDEDFAPHDYEDVAFSTNAIRLGYRLEQLEGTYRHSAASTIGYNSERLAITERNREIFRKKWVG